MTLRPFKYIWLISALTIAVAACGDEPEDAPTHAGTTDADPWQVGWEFPDAPQVGENTLLLTITDDGHGAEGLEVTVEPWMPGHGHGSPETPVVTEGNGGDYTVENLYFTMGGPWEVRIELADGEVEGDGVIEVDVP